MIYRSSAVLKPYIINNFGFEFMFAGVPPKEVDIGCIPNLVTYQADASITTALSAGQHLDDANAVNKKVHTVAERTVNHVNIAKKHDCFCYRFVSTFLMKWGICSIKSMKYRIAVLFRFPIYVYDYEYDLIIIYCSICCTLFIFRDTCDDIVFFHRLINNFFHSFIPF